MGTNEKMRRLTSAVAGIVVMLVGLFLAVSLACGGPGEFLASLYRESWRAHPQPSKVAKTYHDPEVRQ